MLCAAGHTAKGLAVTDDPASDAEFANLLRSDSWDGVMIGSVLTDGDHRHWCERLLNLVREAAPQAKFVFPNSPDDILPSIKRVLG
ncbi:hypothetical protein WJX73_008980 [Symbiochloris irregularis]|uniref:Tryptophan synthase n=1 Tax=Symbiochloris irregularis TaxID=706552 RepID=A0AAW1PMS1_9CHLO